MYVHTRAISAPSIRAIHEIRVRQEKRSLRQEMLNLFGNTYSASRSVMQTRLLRTIYLDGL